MKVFITIVAAVILCIGTILLWVRGFQIVSSISFIEWSSADFLVIAIAPVSLFGTIKQLLWAKS